MKRVNKGDYGYVSSQKKVELVKTVFMLALSLGLYFMGIATTGDNKNLLTFVAVFGTLPMAKFCVNFIMFLKARGTSKDLYDEVSSVNSTDVLYDLYFTDYKKSYQISALIYKKGSVIAITEDPKLSILDAEAHIKEVLANINVTNVTVKVYSDKQKFMERLSTLSEETVDAPSNYETVIDNLLSVSL